MKNVLTMMLVMCLVGAVQADLWTDGGADPDFESRTDDGAGYFLAPNFGYWFEGSSAGSSDLGVKFNADADMVTAGITAKTGSGFAFQYSGASGINTMTDPVPVDWTRTVRFGTWARSETGFEPAILEMGFDNGGAGGAWVSNGTIVDIGTDSATNTTDTPNITTSWQYYEIDNVENTINSGVLEMSGKMGVRSPGAGVNNARIYWDAASLFYAPIPYATNPVPADGIAVSPAADLSWTQAVSECLDTVTVDVWILDAGTSPPVSDPNMGPTVFDTGVGTYTQLADDEAITAVDLSAEPYTLVAGHTYYWAVHSTDPNTCNSGVAVTTKGFTWDFNIGDELPQPNAGPDVFAWVNRDDDGDGNPLEYTFTMVGTYTDDGKSVISDANWLNLGWDIDKGEAGLLKTGETWTHNGAGGTGPGTTHTAGTVTATYKTVDGTTTIPGYWDLQLQVLQDAGGPDEGTGIDVAYTRVDEDCVASAIAEEGDDWGDAGETLGDLNLDCKTNLTDFALLASNWLECHSTKSGVTCP